MGLSEQVNVNTHITTLPFVSSCGYASLFTCLLQGYITCFFPPETRIIFQNKQELFFMSLQVNFSSRSAHWFVPELFVTWSGPSRLNTTLTSGGSVHNIVLSIWSFVSCLGCNTFCQTCYILSEGFGEKWGLSWSCGVFVSLCVCVSSCHRQFLIEPYEEEQKNLSKIGLIN